MDYPVDLLAVLDFIKQYRTFAIIGHEEPDGDSLGSHLALGSFLQRLGKEASCYSPGPFLRPEIQDLEDRFATKSLEPSEAAIVVDCSTLDRIGRYAAEITELPMAVIDHHARGIPFGDVRYVDPNAPSVTFLILKLIEAAGEKPTREEAGLLFLGLCTDTGFFRHLEQGSQETFAASGRLIAAGASPKDTFAKMFGNRTHDSRKLLGRLLKRAEQRFNGKVIVAWETKEELKEFGKEQRDSDALYQQLQMVRGCEIVILVRQEEIERCSVGLRSSGAIDVGTIAKQFGGGGHRNASGYDRHGRVPEVLAEIIDYFESVLP